VLYVSLDAQNLYMFNKVLYIDYDHLNIGIFFLEKMQNYFVSFHWVGCLFWLRCCLLYLYVSLDAQNLYMFNEVL
jgi:hypothetical protein